MTKSISEEAAKIISAASFIIGFHNAKLKTMVSCFKDYGGLVSTETVDDFVSSKNPYELTDTFVHASSKSALDEAFLNLPAHLSGVKFPPTMLRFIAKSIRDLETQLIAGTNRPYRLRRFDLIF